MSDVFISYSRKDIAFARLLNEALEESELETWIDWQDIPPSVDWLAEVYAAIEQADTFVFLISPDSVASEVCGYEVEHAVAHNKRLVPVVVSSEMLGGDLEIQDQTVDVDITITDEESRTVSAQASGVLRRL